MTKLKKRHLWETHDKWMELKLKTTSKELDTATVFALNEKILALFEGQDSPDNEFNDLVTVLLRCCVPNHDRSNMFQFLIQVCWCVACEN